jgi:hypothetical protein
MDVRTAIKKLQSNEISAMVYLLRAPDAVQTGADLADASAIKKMQLGDNLHLLPLPESDELSKLYTPSNLSSADLPGFLGNGQSVPTYAVDAIIAAYSWAPSHPRYQRSERFVNALMDGLDELQSEVYQPAWKRVKFGLKTPNIDTLPIMEESIEQRLNEQEQRTEKAELARAREDTRVRAEKLVELMKKREELSERLGEVLNEADSAELERMLTELNSILESN